jgi:hypothetical protein
VIPMKLGTTHAKPRPSPNSLTSLQKSPLASGSLAPRPTTTTAVRFATGGEPVAGNCGMKGFLMSRHAPDRRRACSIANVFEPRANLADHSERRRSGDPGLPALGRHQRSVMPTARYFVHADCTIFRQRTLPLLCRLTASADPGHRRRAHAEEKMRIVAQRNCSAAELHLFDLRDASLMRSDAKSQINLRQVPKLPASERSCVIELEMKRARHHPLNLSVDKLPGAGGQSKRLNMEIPANSEVAALPPKRHSRQETANTKCRKPASSRWYLRQC